MGCVSYSVGSAYPEFKHSDTLIRCAFDGLSWTFTIGFPGITKQEIHEVMKGTASFAFSVINDMIFLLAKFGEIPWCDAPFDPAKCAEDVVFRSFDGEFGAAMVVQCVDTRTGILKGIRTIGLSTPMSNGLHDVCREMNLRHRPYNETKYKAALNSVYKRFPDSASMVPYASPTHITVIVPPKQ